MSLGMRRMMNVTASTKRAAATAGKYGTPTAKLTGVLCLPVDPLSASESSDLQLRNVLKSPLALYKTVVTGGLDIIAGDIFTAGGVDYNVRIAEDWAASTNQGDRYLKLVLEKVKP